MDAPNDEDDVRTRRKRRFFLVRVSLLLFVLFVVVLYAIRDIRGRRARNDWTATVDVAIVLVQIDGNAPVDESAVRALAERVPALEDRLRAEAERHRPGMPKPFHMRLFGPVAARTPPPKAQGDGVADLVRKTLDSRRWFGDVDPRAGLDPDHWDTRIYVSARRPQSETRSFVEGESEQGGRTGVVDVELDDSMVDSTLFVVAHELLHTLGATDKYDANGRTLVPDGLAEPDRTPLYPQRRAEVMARNRPVTPEAEVIPESLDELAIGGATAREIGWVR